jgi:hypothetical protein
MGASSKIIKDYDVDFTNYFGQDDVRQFNLSRQKGMVLLRKLSLSWFIDKNYTNFSK